MSFYQICSVDDRITLFVVSLQTTLATFGIETQTPLQIEPIQIWPSSQLVKVLHTSSVISKNFSSGKMLFLGCFGVFLDIEPFAHTSRETFCFCLSPQSSSQGFSVPAERGCAYRLFELESLLRGFSHWLVM